MTFSTIASLGVSLQGGGGSGGGGAASLPISGNGATVTASTPLVDGTQTWNDGAVTFTGLKYNATDTASAAASLLMDLQVGASSRFNVGKTGSLKLGVSPTGTNQAGTNVTIAGSQGTGTGAGGSIIFQVAPAGSSGSAQNALVDALTISSTRVVTIAANASSLAQIAMADRGTVISAYATGFGAQPLLISMPGGIQINNDTGGFLLGGAADVILTRRGAANLRFGAADAAAPVAQTLSVQSVVAGTTNIAGANLTITGSQGTGTGAGGSIIFQVAPAGSSGTAQNALAAALTIDSTKLATFADAVRTSAPSGGTAANWKLGTVATVTPTLQNRTIEVDIGGTIYYISAKTTND